MNYDQLIEHFGTQTAAAAALGVNQASVSDWKRNGIPHIRQLHVEHVTDGDLKADPLTFRKADQQESA